MEAAYKHKGRHSSDCNSEGHGHGHHILKEIRTKKRISVNAKLGRVLDIL